MSYPSCQKRFHVLCKQNLLAGVPAGTLQFLQLRANVGPSSILVTSTLQSDVVHLIEQVGRSDGLVSSVLAFLALGIDIGQEVRQLLQVCILVVLQQSYAILDAGTQSCLIVQVLTFLV